MTHLVRFFSLFTLCLTINETLSSFRECKTDLDCQPKSKCNTGLNNGYSGKCKCLDGYQFIPVDDKNYTCTKMAKIGDFCKDDTDCFASAGSDSLCIDNKCQCCENCKQDSEGICTQKIELGKVCISNSACNWIENAICSDIGNCSCKSGMIPSHNNDSCIKPRALGEKCDSNDECSENLICPNSRCNCPADFVSFRDGLKCLETSKNIGDLCEEDIQCSTLIQNSECQENKCACNSETIQNENNCVKPVKTNNNPECENDKDCNSKRNKINLGDCTNNNCITTITTTKSSVVDAYDNPDDDNSSARENYLKSSLIALICVVLLVLLFAVFCILRKKR